MFCLYGHSGIFGSAKIVSKYPSKESGISIDLYILQEVFKALWG
jgi:hypothetical protein